MKFPDEIQSIAVQSFDLIALTPARISYLFSLEYQQLVWELLGNNEERYERYRMMHAGGMETFRFTAFYFLIRNSAGQTIGECGFHHIDKRHHKGELFYLLYADSDKRKGVISTVLPAILSYGFNELGLHRIYAKISKENVPSIRLVEKNNFLHEGTLHEDYLVDGKYESSEIYALVAK